ncbi:MAG: CBS domain-containing protein [Methanophagales archaeon]|nr:CBS domain-containing protein [Methanophagales archaeon]MEA1956863.1 CBS domain-containing protein [Euryarchaeota archaeon]
MVQNKEKQNGQTRIRDIMVENVAYVTLPGIREEIMKICKDRYISGVPVVKGGKVEGVVTRQDLLKNPNERQIALLMSRNPITISPEATIAEAARIILSRRIRRLPVVEGEKLVGIITVADIVREIAKGGYKAPIGNYMGEKTIAIWNEMPLSVAGRIMELGRVKAAPVLNLEFELVGLITDRDLINAAVIEDETGHSDLSLGADEDAWTWEGMRDTMKLYYGVSKMKLPDKRVSEVMVKEVVTATRNCEVNECAGKMSENKFDQLPVISTRGKLTGMLLDRNLLKVLE